MIGSFVCLALALNARPAAALDVEPNETCAAGEVLPLAITGLGEIASGSDLDVFRFSTSHGGLLLVELENLSNSADDFLVLATDAATSATLDSASSELGYLSLTLAIGEDSVTCVELSGSEGSYRLRTSFVPDPPLLDEIQDSSGAPITEALRGDVVFVIGERLSGPGDEVKVIFGGAIAEVEVLDETELMVTIPANAVDGEVQVWVKGQESNALAIEVGETTPESPTSHTTPDPAYFSGLADDPVILNRSFVTFRADLDRDGVEVVLDDVISAVSAWSDWTIVGALPMLNGFQVEWTYADPSGFPDLDDLVEVMGALTLEDDVYSVSPEGLLRPHNELTLANDFDLLWANDTATGAMAQISLAEASRLVRFSGLSNLAADPGMVIFDTGLYFGTGWHGPARVEFPTRTFSLWEYSSGTGWGETAAPGHAWAPGGSVNHGNQTAGLVAAANQGDPDWFDGSARALANMSGIWSSFDLFGINDDEDDESGAGLLTDDPGESIPHSVVVVNNNTVAGSADSRPLNLSDLFIYGLAATTFHADLKDYVFVFPQGLNLGQSFTIETDDPTTPDFDESKLNRAARGLVAASCARHIFVVSAGNEGAVQDDVDDLETIARWAKEACGEQVLVVGGTHAGGFGPSADVPAYHTSLSTSNRGAAVDMAAPYDAWTLAGARWNAGAGKPYLTYETGSQARGTSFSAPAVAAAVGLHAALWPEQAVATSAKATLDRSDDIQAISTAFKRGEHGAVARLNLFEVVHDGLLRSGALPLHRRQIRVYAVDEDDDMLVSQVVSPDDGVRESGTVVSRYLGTEGCTEPVDVEVHPLGDVVYVLCRGSLSIGAYTATELDPIGSVTLEGEVGGRTEMEILPSGILYVATRDELGAMMLESFDTWTGAREAPSALLWDTFTTSTPVGMGAAVHPDGTSLAVMLSDQYASSDDYDVLVQVHPDHDDADKEGSLAFESLTSLTGTYVGRDLAWKSDGSAALSVFYQASGTDAELVLADFDGTTSKHTVSDDCDFLDSVAVDPTQNTDFAFVACRKVTGTTDRKVAVIDLASAPSSFTPSTSIFANSGSATTYRNTRVDVADNGRFVTIVIEPRGTGYGYVRTVAMEDIEEAVATSDTLDPTDTSQLSYAFDTPAGVAITPTISIANPRPGTLLRGARRLHIVLRDPAVSEVKVYVDEVLICTDTELKGQHSKACILDSTSWAGGVHEVKVVATVGEEYDYSRVFPFEAE